MEAEARYTYVGAAVLALIAALVASVVWLKNVGSRNDFNHYAIHFERQALDGLAVGADVNLRGIKVGRVEDYALAGDKLNRVRVVVRVDRRAPVRTGTEAVITRNFVTGIAAITLLNREPAGETLVDIPDGERLPVIAEGRNDFDEITGRVHKIGEMAALALSNLNQLLNDENRRDALAAVRSLRDLAQGLNKRLGTLDSALQQVGGAASEVGAAAGQLGRSGERVAAVAERGGEQLGQAVAEAERALAEARRAMAQINASTAALQAQTTGTAQRLEATAAGVEDQLGVAVGELRSSLDAATRVLDKLREPRAALLGPSKAQLGPGEKLP